jgi:hypothetical protein
VKSRSSPTLSGLLATLLAAMLTFASASPCTAFAAPEQRAAVQALADPCRAHHAMPNQACAQLACQQAADLGSAAVTRVPAPSSARFVILSAAAGGRTDAPPLPPPRLL